ncbi:MAG: glycosyl hydrolase 115 family protein [Bacteroidaceae bacterium]|nr:glycosyl hydrolase 115 family protein [Bacteroidaceae bacterium]
MQRFSLIFTLCLVALVADAQDFVLKAETKVAVYMPPVSEPVASTALQMLAGDMETVLGVEIVPVKKEKKAQVVAVLDDCLPREGFRLYVEKGRLIIRGADAHGLAYGLLEVSRLMGVSPWVWWADCLPTRQTTVRLPQGFTSQQSPAVAYRGIFINDEDWGILPWSGGVIGPETNERIFQLMLRLRANYYWPSMHEVSTPFFTIEGNREMAHKYGIYVGGSHCEPMGTSPAKEWKMRGVGDYNYVTNKENVQKFWAERLDEVKGQDMVYTIGMRGVHDGSMQGVKTKEEKLYYLQQVIDDQRAMLAAHVNPDVTQIPQVFVPYKEVLDIYHAGLKVPDDVTLMWTDDNYGYIRHFPDSIERSRRGGNGLYYHISYWGRPHDYLWLGTFLPDLMRQQLTEAYRRGIRQMWILNVGDIKPAEYQVEDFLNMAWEGVEKHDEQTALRQFLEREFGDTLADTLSSIVMEHYRLAFDRKPEHMGGTRVEESDRQYWNTFRPIDGWSREDVAQRVAAYQRLSDAVEALEERVPEHRKDAYFQLVKYPVQAAAQMNFKFLVPERSAEAYDSIVALTHIYNSGPAWMSHPKWKGIMDMAPRKLAVFGKVEEPLTYPEAKPETILFESDTWLSVRLDEERTFTFESAASEVDAEIRLLPNHPVVGDRLTFSVSVDGGEPQVFDYQTYDRSEEWKQNVLRNYALRRMTLPLSSSPQNHPQGAGGLHTLTFKALTEGVYLRRISISR